MKKSIVSFYFLLLFITSFSQKNEFIPASPTVAELAKYGQVPVSYYTGQPNISFPLYNIICGTLELPISLSYNASGIKVDQEASWVGLGWSLNAGGIIQSTIVGKADLEHNNVFNILTVDYNTGEINGTVPHFPEPRPEELEEPDMYSYNFCGYTGQFIFDKNRNIHFLKSDQKLKITENTTPLSINGNERTVFTATDNAGVTYKFELNEWSVQYIYKYGYSIVLDNQHGNDGTGLIPDSEGGLGAHQTAWFLTEMIAPNGIDKITFEYDEDIEVSTSSLQGSLTYAPEPFTHEDYEWYGDGELSWYPCTGGDNHFGSSTGSFSKIRTTNHTKKLKKITTSTGITIDFSRFNLREDIQGYLQNQNKRLDEISIFYNQTFIKKWSFQYSYFTSSLEDITRPYLNKRLRLASVQEYSASNEEEPMPPYAFRYFGDDAGENKMPYRTCYSGKDYFGYCNSVVTTSISKNVKKIFPRLVSSSIKRVPHYIYTLACAQMDCNFGASIETVVKNSDQYQYGDFTFSFIDGSDRKANLDYTKAFTIKQIDYPTGGRTIFDYELHTFNDISNGVTYYGSPQEPLGGLRIKKITDIPNIGENIIRTFSYDNNGILMDYPVFAHPFTHISYCEGPSSVGLRYYVFMLNSNELNNLYSVSGENIAYKSVTENITGNGRVVYKYYSGKEFPASYDTYYCGYFNGGNDPEGITFKVHLQDAIYPYYRGFDYKDYARGILKEIAYLNETGDTIKKETNYYDFIDGPKLFGNQVETLGEGNSRINIYHHNTGIARLKERKVFEFFGNGNNAVTTTNYLYNSYNLISEESTNQSDETILKTKYKYPCDYTDKISTDIEGKSIIEMANRYIINDPLEIIQLKGSTIISGALNTYKILNYDPQNPTYISDKIVPFRNYLLDLNSPLPENLFQPSNTNSINFLKDNRYRLVAEFETYDEYCNPKQIYKVDEIRTSYIWDYDQRYPVAKVINASLSQINYSGFEEKATSGQVYYGEEWECGHASIHCNDPDNPAHTGRCCIENQGSTISSIKTFPAGKYKISLYARNKKGYSGGSIISSSIGGEPMWAGGSTKWTHNERVFTLSAPQKIVLTLSDGILIDDLSIYPVEAQMTTYTYDPLIGMTSQTDPNGVTTYYEYDGFGRLKYIKDDDGNILKSYEYNYKE